MNSSLLSVLVLLGLSCSLVSSRPSPQDPDSEVIVRVPPPVLPSVPFFLASPGEGSVIGEVVVRSEGLAVKTKRKKNSKTEQGPTFAARVDPQAPASIPLDDTNSVGGDTIFFNQPSTVIQLS